MAVAKVYGLGMDTPTPKEHGMNPDEMHKRIVELERRHDERGLLFDEQVELDGLYEAGGY